jgi:hypothetical protein
MAGPACGRVGLLVLVTCLAAAVSGSTVPLAGAAAAAPVVAAAKETLSPSSVKVAEAATAPAAASAVPAAAAAPVPEAASAPSAPAGAEKETPARAAKQPVHDNGDEQNSEELENALQEYFVLRDSLRTAYRKGLTLKGDEEYAGMHPGFKLPSVLVRRPGAPPSNSMARERELYMELRKVNLTAEELKAVVEAPEEGPKMLEGTAALLKGGRQPAPAKTPPRSKEELEKLAAGKGALKEPVYVEHTREDGTTVGRELRTAEEVHTYLALTFERKLDALAGVGRFEKANRAALTKKHAGATVDAIIASERPTGGPSAEQRNASAAAAGADEALAKMVMQLGPRGKADGPMAKYPPWDLRRAARLHTPETGKAPPSPDAEDKLPVPPSDLTLRRAAIQKVEIADVGNDARQLHEKFWARFSADPIPTQIVAFAKKAVVSVRPRAPALPPLKEARDVSD